MSRGEHGVFTIGHSTHPQERFLALLRQHRIEAIGDVRSTPHSRRNPQFNRQTLERSLEESGISYLFLGRELGARTEDPSCYVSGKVRYDLLAGTELFQQGLARVREAMQDRRLALMCAEKEPLECHRTILIARHLEALGASVQHILADGGLESHEQALDRLVRRLRPPPRDIEEAYRVQGERIAYEAPVADR